MSKALSSYGRVKVLLARRSRAGTDLSGEIGVASVGMGSNLQESDLLDAASTAFDHARYGVARFLESFLDAGSLIAPRAQGLGEWRPTGPSGRRIDGSSLGWPFFLALLSGVLEVDVREDALATGTIDPAHPGGARVAGNRNPPATLAKLDPRIVGTNLVFLPSEDYHAIVDLVSNGAQLRPVEWLSKDSLDALATCFGKRPAEFRALCKRRATSLFKKQRGSRSRLPSAALLDWLEGQYRAGVRYCSNDPELFLSASVFFAFAATQLESAPRAPEVWPRLDSLVKYGPVEQGRFAEFARSVIDRLVKSLPDVSDAVVGPASEAVVTRLSSPSSANFYPRNVLNEDIILAHVQVPETAQRTIEELRLEVSRMELINRQLADPTGEGRTPIFQQFQELVRRLVPERADIDLPEAMGQRGWVRLDLPAELRSISVITEGTGLINCTLGGAWWLAFALRYLIEEPMSSNIRRPAWYERVFGFGGQRQLATLKQIDEVRRGFAESAELGPKGNGAYAAFWEFIMMPRVHYEILPPVAGGRAANPRYPAEKTVCLDFVRSIFRAAPDDVRGKLEVYWNHQPLPHVGEIIADRIASDWVPGVQRIGEVALQDYAGYGRTPATSRFLRVGALSDLASVGLPAGPYDDRFRWGLRGGKDEANVLNLRSALVGLSEALREQVVLNQLLHGREPVNALPKHIFESIRWGSLTPPGSAIDVYLWGGSDERSRSRRPRGAEPVYWDPITWRGLGLPALLAFEAVIAARMLFDLKELWRTTDPASEIHAQYQMSLREVAHFISNDYVAFLDRAMQVVERACELLNLTRTQGSEIGQALADMKEVRAYLPKLLVDIDDQELLAAPSFYR